MAKVGYARVSTPDQNSALQEDALKEAGASQVYVETASGKNAERPELAHCLKALRPGDCLLVWRLDRLGRNLRDLIQIAEDLNARGIALRSLNESIDTTGPVGRLIFHVFAALAEFERNLIRERTLAGLSAARARGRNGGRHYSLGPAKRAAVVAAYDSKESSVAEIAREFHISRATVNAYVQAARDKKSATSTSP